MHRQETGTTDCGDLVKRCELRNKAHAFEMLEIAFATDRVRITRNPVLLRMSQQVRNIDSERTILPQEIRRRAGIMVVAKGQEITQPLLIKLNNFARGGAMDREVLVWNRGNPSEQGSASSIFKMSAPNLGGATHYSLLLTSNAALPHEPAIRKQVTRNAGEATASPRHPKCHTVRTGYARL